jgi:hypothetical protein
MNQSSALLGCTTGLGNLAQGRLLSMSSSYNESPGGLRAAAVRWDIRRDGRAWHGDEADDRYQLTPEKFEMYEGRLFWSHEERLLLLGLLLENLGADAAVRLGDPQVWRDAVASLPRLAK